MCRESASTKQSRRSSCVKKSICLALSLAVLAANIPNIYHQAAHLATAESCADVHFVFARGSGSELNAGDYRAWHSSLQQILKKSTLQTKFYELGTSSHGGAQYPAVGIGNDSPQGIFTAVGALVGAGNSYKFGNSVREGIAELRSYITETAHNCPQTKFVLGGYSQGAMVISEALPQLNADKIIYAATFGDPKLYLPEGQGTNPPACQRRDLSNYRVYVPDCYTDEGILRGLQPYQPTNYHDKLGTWCNDQDFMCGSKWNFKNLLGAHLGYTEQNRYAHAANIISEKLNQTFPSQISTTKTAVSTHDLAILIDTTGSMSSLIDTYRAEALKLAAKITAQGGRVALYQYRDLADPYEPNQVLDFTSDLSEFEHALSSLSTSGGGDEDESALHALLHTMNTLKWQSGATKSIVLLTDAGYHLNDNDVNLATVTKRSKEIDPVNIYTLTPADIANKYTELTAQTYGRTFTTNDELELSTKYIIEHDDLIIDEPELTKAAITNLQITPAGNSATVSFTPSANTAKTLLVLNDTPLGFVNDNFTITDLNGANTLTLIPISHQGRTGTPSTTNFTTSNLVKLKVPDCGFKQNQL